MQDKQRSSLKLCLLKHPDEDTVSEKGLACTACIEGSHTFAFPGIQEPTLKT